MERMAANLFSTFTSMSWVAGSLAGLPARNFQLEAENMFGSCQYTEDWNLKLCVFFSLFYMFTIILEAIPFAFLP